MSKITLKGFILVPESDLSAVISELPNHIALTRKEKGCLVFDVLQDDDNSFRFSVVEVFVSFWLPQLNKLNVISINMIN